MIRRGEIWWANLPPPEGSEPGYRRPVVIVQSDRFNASGLRTFLGVALTGNLDLADMPGNVLLRRRATGLPYDSVANVTQVVTSDREILSEYVGDLPGSLVRRLDDGLRLVFDL